MARNFKNFKNYKKKTLINENNNKNNKRIVGYTTMKVPVYGSESNLVRPLTIHSLALFELYDKKEKEYIKKELYIFKEYTNNNLYTSKW